MKIIPLLLAVVASAARAAEIEPPKLSLSGQIRTRVESSNIESYAAPGRRRGMDATYLRARLGVAADAGRGVKGFLQLQDSRTWGTEASVVANSANVDLHQGYVDVLDLFDAPLDLRAGRMELQYGDQRLVSPLDWSNVGRAWDGARLRWRGGSVVLDAFGANVKDNATARRSGKFWGLYGSCRAVDKHEFDLFVLGRDQGDLSFVNEHGTAGNLSDRTAGARVKGASGGFDYTGEADWQFGRKAGQRVRAWATAATAGYVFEHALKPRVGVEHDFASGDADPGDNQLQTFDPLYPFGHAYQGYQDIFSWKNGHDFKGSVSVDPVAGWRVQVDGHDFLLHRRRDAWYDAAGTSIARSSAGTAGRHVGSEVDVHVRGKFRDVVSLWFGYSRFFAGAYARSLTGRGNRDWGFFSASLDF